MGHAVAYRKMDACWTTAVYAAVITPAARIAWEYPMAAPYQEWLVTQGNWEFVLRERTQPLVFVNAITTPLMEYVGARTVRV